MSSTWTILSHPAHALLCRMTSRRALSASLNIFEENHTHVKVSNGQSSFNYFQSTFSFGFTVPTGQDFSIDANAQRFFRDVVSIGNRITTSGKRKWTTVFRRTRWPRAKSQINGQLSIVTEFLMAIDDTYVRVITWKGALPRTLTFCVCCCWSSESCVSSVLDVGEASNLVLIFRKRSRNPIYRHKWTLKLKTSLQRTEKGCSSTHVSICSLSTTTIQEQWPTIEKEWTYSREKSEFLLPVVWLDRYIYIGRETEWRVVT